MPRTQRKGPDFEKAVGQLLRLRGYRVTENELIAGTQIDLVARRDDVLDNICLLVECGDRSTSVGVDLIKTKSAVLVAVNNADTIYRVLYVSRNGFTAEAKAFAAGQPHIVLMTYQQLEQQLVDFDPYTSTYREAYEKSEGQFVEGSLFGHFIDPEIQENNRRRDSLIRETQMWLTDDTHQLLFILGEYGAGKTSTARHLTYEWIVRQSAGEGKPLAPVPILVNLRDYRRSLNIQQMLADTLTNQYGVRLTSFAAFERLAGTGRVVLVLDGLDEMLSSFDDAAIADAFAQLLVLAAAKVKTVITCRTNLFESHRRLLLTLSRLSIVVDGETSRQLLPATVERSARIMTIVPWDPERIQSFVHSKSPENAAQILEAISSVHDLSDLSSRPVLLDMVVKTISRLSQSATPVNTASLYSAYTDRWTARDDWRAKTSGRLRMEICEALALALHQAGLNQIQYSVLRDVLIEATRSLSVDQVRQDDVESDIRVCSFLIRSSEETFRFAHSSFQEYFIGRILAQRLLENVPERGLSRDGVALATLLLSALSPENTHADTPADSFITLSSNVASAVNASQSFDGWNAGLFRNQLLSVVGDRLANLRFPTADTGVSITPEIAAFALEEMSLHADLVLEELYRDKSSKEPLLAELLRTAPVTQFARGHAEQLKMLVSDPRSSTVLVVSALVALSRFDASLEPEFLVIVRNRADPEAWLYCLFETVHAGVVTSEVIASALAGDDSLSLVERLLVLVSRSSDWPVSRTFEDVRMLAAEIVTVENHEEQLLAATLLSSLKFETEGEAVAFFRELQDQGVSPEVKLSCISLLEDARGVNAPTVIRSLWMREGNSEVRRALQHSEQRLRNKFNRDKERASWADRTNETIRTGLTDRFHRQ